MPLSARRVLTGCALALLAAPGCLDHGSPYLAFEDQERPRVLNTRPTRRDAGVETIGKTTEIEVGFSEQMDPTSLKPGIVVLRRGEEVPLLFSVIEELPADGLDRGDIPFSITAKPTTGSFAPNEPHTLVLRTLLTDTEGNPVDEEIRVNFQSGP